MSSSNHYSWACAAKVGNPLAKAILILLAQDMNDLAYRSQRGAPVEDPFSGVAILFGELELAPNEGWAIIADLLDRGFLVVNFGLVTGAPEKPVDWRASVEPKRRAIFERDGWRCTYCGSGDSLTIDHVVPRTKGGGNEPSNLRTACKPCNSSKGSRDLYEWLNLRAVDVGDVI